VAGRLNGSDLALYLPVNGVAAETADALATTLRVGLTAVDAAAELAIGAVEGLPAGAASQALARADEALARAEAGGPFAVHVADGGAGAATGEREWRQRILGALDRGRARLGEFPLVDASGALVHLECPLRVQLQDGGPYEAAALWLPMASRGRLTQRVDRTAAELALRAIEADGRPRCVHVASASLADPAFVREIERLLAAAGRAARSLSLELGPLAPADAQRLRGAAALWRPHGVTLGIENAGDSLRQLLDVHAFGLDYLKVDARFVHGLARDATLAEYARQVAASARAIGVKAYASGIAEAADLARLWELGFDGATGPGVAA
jgi:EAL domain-containing protein (putative c-di-GMP-specific phosphodiesterase class I)